MNGMLRSKTMWFSFLLAIFSVLELNLGLLREMVKPEYVGYVTLGISVITGALRWVTTQPLSNK